MAAETFQFTGTDKAGHPLGLSLTLNHQTPAPPPPSAGMPPLIGSSSRDTDWNTRKAMLEAGGGKLEARRLFAASMTDDLTSLFNEAAAQGHVPVFSFKPSPYTWAQIANGQATSGLTTVANRLAAYNRPVFVTCSHEPGKQSLGAMQGEAGTAADFGRAMAYLADWFHQRCPKVKVGPIMNGWMFSAQARGFSDAELDVWLPAATRAKIDFVAADHYAAQDETEKALTRLQRQVAWMKRVGFTGSAGVGEANGWTPSDLTGLFGYAKTEPLFRDGFVLLWNSTVSNPTPEDWRPVHETGLLDDFQSILAGWRA